MNNEDVNKKIDQNALDIKALKQLVMKNNFSNLFVFDTPVRFRRALNYSTRVVIAAGAVDILARSDDIVVVNKSVGAATVINLPVNPSLGDTYTIKDGKGDAAANNITVTPAAGTIDGGATFVMATNYQSVMLVFNGTEWNKI